MISPEGPILNAGWETVFYAIPFVLLAITVIFRLDRLFVGPGRRSGKLRALPGCDNRGQPAPRDPDGRLFLV